MILRPRVLTLWFIGFLVAGCGSQGPKTYEVGGTVTWQDVLIARGDIIFEPVDGSIIPSAGKIVDGKYRMRVTAGWQRVQIHASREVPGKIDPVMHSPVREDFIPERYNAKTTLKVEVREGGDNHWDFRLPEKGIAAARDAARSKSLRKEPLARPSNYSSFLPARK